MLSKQTTHSSIQPLTTKKIIESAIWQQRTLSFCQLYLQLSTSVNMKKEDLEEKRETKSTWSIWNLFIFCSFVACVSPLCNPLYVWFFVYLLMSLGRLARARCGEYRPPLGHVIERRSQKTTLRPLPLWVKYIPVQKASALTSLSLSLIVCGPIWASQLCI